MKNGIERKFARPAPPRNKGKAKRVLQRSMKMWIRSIATLRSIAKDHQLVFSMAAKGSSLTKLWEF